MGTNDREDSEEQDKIRWDREYGSKRTVNKSYESEARFREERQQERDEYEAALEGLGKIGWPCRLRELPDEYAKLGLKLQEVRAELQKEKERAALYYSRWEGMHAQWAKARREIEQCYVLIGNIDDSDLTFNEVEIKRLVAGFLEKADDSIRPTSHIAGWDPPPERPAVGELNGGSGPAFLHIEDVLAPILKRLDRLEERAVHGVREVMDGELCCEHYSPEKCGCRCEGGSDEDRDS
jgi:hypothetical protein